LVLVSMITDVFAGVAAGDYLVLPLFQQARFIQLDKLWFIYFAEVKVLLLELLEVTLALLIVFHFVII